MSLYKAYRYGTILGMAMVTVAGGPAAAQDRGEVREVLNRAETQAARRSVEDLLTSIGITSRANAQTLPARDPAGQVQGAAQPVSAPTGDAPVAVAQGTPRASGTPAAAPSAPTAAGASVGPSGSVAAPALPGTGSPADPTMIVRVPGATEAVAAPTATAAPAAIPAPVAAGRTIEASATAGPGGRTVVGPLAANATVAPASVVLVRPPAGRRQAAEWCPPGRF